MTLFSSKSLFLADRIEFMSLESLRAVSVCFSLVRTISSSIFVCSCWKDFGDVGISCFFLFLGLVPVLEGPVDDNETEEATDED